MDEEIKFYNLSIWLQVAIIGGWLAFIGFVAGFARGLFGL